MTWDSLLVLGYYLFVTAVVVGILMENRNPMKTMGFILVLYLIPVGGLIIYFLFGQNHRKRKLFSRKGIRDNEHIRSWELENISQVKSAEEVTKHFLQDKWKVVNSLFNSDRAVLTTQNSWKLLRNGGETFEALMEAIQKAQHHIHIEYYIVEDDDTGRDFRDALIEKAKSGVEVRFIYDDVGSMSLKRRFLRPMRDAGIEVKPFMPVLFPLLTSRANYRDHRKVVIVDGKVGFTGGVNLSSRYANTRADRLFWRDTHLRIEGDAVKSLQMHFLLMWRFVNDSAPQVSIEYFPDVDVDDITLVQIAASGPDSDWANILSAIFTAINTAQREILITTPYFIPNDEILFALQTAALSGIQVKMILPKKSDSRLVQAAMMSYVKEMLEAGVKVYLYEKGFIHAKTMVVDESLSTVGTSNMDYRSFDINFEINAFVYDNDMAKALKSDFQSDLQSCTEITLERWEKRVLRRRISESFARLVAPLL